jgi:hypothetical protein
MQQAIAQRPFFAAAPAAGGQQLCRGGRRAAPAGRPVVVASAAELAEGSRIRVKTSVKIYHSGKFKGGLDLQGMEGTVIKPNVCDYKHHDGKQHLLSANLPVQVQFMAPAPDGGKDVKILAHLVSAAAQRQQWLAGSGRQLQIAEEVAGSSSRMSVRRAVCRPLPANASLCQPMIFAPFLPTHCTELLLCCCCAVLCPLLCVCRRRRRSRLLPEHWHYADADASTSLSFLLQ